MGQARLGRLAACPWAAHSLVGRTDYEIVQDTHGHQRLQSLAPPRCPLLMCLGSFNLKICHAKVLLLSSFCSLGTEVLKD